MKWHHLVQIDCKIRVFIQKSQNKHVENVLQKDGVLWEPHYHQIKEKEQKQQQKQKQNKKQQQQQQQNQTE